MENELLHKVINGLERISEGFKTLIWEQAKQHGLSPIQIQILLFISDHKASLCNVSHLALEFNVTKPTISDAVKVLVQKDLALKDHSSSDHRSYILLPSTKGKKLTAQLKDYHQPLQDGLKSLSDPQLESLYTTLTELIYKLNVSGIFSVQRTCFGCRFYSKTQGQHHCSLLQKQLSGTELRIDCPEYESRA